MPVLPGGVGCLCGVEVAVQVALGNLPLPVAPRADCAIYVLMALEVCTTGITVLKSGVNESQDQRQVALAGWWGTTAGI